MNMVLLYKMTKKRKMMRLESSNKIRKVAKSMEMSRKMNSIHLEVKLANQQVKPF